MLKNFKLGVAKLLHNIKIREQTMSRRLKKTHLFSKDVAALMYAYGDVPQPLPESVQCVDELVSAYLVDICMSAYRTAQTVHRNKIKVEDFKFVLRNDPVKLAW